MSFLRRAAPALVLALGVMSGGCETGTLSSLGPALTDQSPLSNDVRIALQEAPETANLGILVKTLDSGRVRLSGSVPNDGVRNRAEQVAAAVPGVLGVVNTLQLR